MSRSTTASYVRFVWSRTRRLQMRGLFLVVLSMPLLLVMRDLPRAIVDDAIQGRAFTRQDHAPAFQIPWARMLGQVGLGGTPLLLLLALCGVFLVIIAASLALRWLIDGLRRDIGQTILVALRLTIFDRFLRFRPEAIHSVRPGDAAGHIRDRAEPIAAFAGDIVIQPVYLLAQGVTALAFIAVQSPLMALIAFGMVLAQAFVTPMIGRRQTHLLQQGSTLGRRIATLMHVAVVAAPVMRTHETGAYESHAMTARLRELLPVRRRFEINKQIGRFINLLALQLTPLAFYALGGWLVLTGAIEIGQLIAVIAAYRELPPPARELVEWDQKRVETRTRYDIIMRDIADHNLVAPPERPVAPASLREGALELRRLALPEDRFASALEPTSLAVALPAHLALIGRRGQGQETVARAIGRQIGAYEGAIWLGGHNLQDMTRDCAGRLIAFAGEEAILLPGAIRDNVLYGLRRAGGRGDWIDHDALAPDFADNLDGAALAALDLAGLGEGLWRFALGAPLDAVRHPELAGSITALRRAIAHTLRRTGAEDLVEAFDPARYHATSTIGENLAFGLPAAGMGRADILADPFVRQALAASGLDRMLVEMGLRIARTMLEIFAGLPAGHRLFHRFSFIPADEFEEIGALIARWKGQAPPPGPDAARLMQLALSYSEPRHRLGLIDTRAQARLLEARHRIMRDMPAALKARFFFHDPATATPGASLRDNLLFGRIAYGAAGAQERVEQVMRGVLDEAGLRQAALSLALERDIDHHPHEITARHRASICLARCLIKQPDILVIDGALDVWPAPEADALLARIALSMAGRTLIATRDTLDRAAGFAHAAMFENGRLVSSGPIDAMSAPAAQA